MFTFNYAFKKTEGFTYIFFKCKYQLIVLITEL